MGKHYFSLETLASLLLTCRKKLIYYSSGWSPWCPPSHDESSPPSFSKHTTVQSELIKLSLTRSFLFSQDMRQCKAGKEIVGHLVPEFYPPLNIQLSQRSPVDGRRGRSLLKQILQNKRWFPEGFSWEVVRRLMVHLSELLSLILTSLSGLLSSLSRRASPASSDI